MKDIFVKSIKWIGCFLIEWFFSMFVLLLFLFDSKIVLLIGLVSIFVLFAILHLVLHLSANLLLWIFLGVWVLSALALVFLFDLASEEEEV